ncbi:MAG TPA: hypothetical protein QF571_09205 [Desulfobacterales bacterium]|nr:hypothetical protein [Desulfobacterales bacterium]
MRLTGVATAVMILFMAAAHAPACNIERFRFGSSPDSVRDRIGMAMPKKGLLPEQDNGLDAEEPTERPDREVIAVAGEEACRYTRLFKKTEVDFHFLFDRLVQIQIRLTTEKPSLIEWAEKKYGVVKNKPRSFFAKRKNAEFFWDKKDTLVFYFVHTVAGKTSEYLEITSKKHDALFEKNAEKEERAFEKTLKKTGEADR